MDPLFFSWITIHSLYVTGIHYGITIFSRIHNEFALFFTNLLWIHYLFYAFTMILLRISQIHYLTREFTMTSPFVSQIHYEITIYLVILQIYKEFTIFFMISLWFYLGFREFTVFFANYGDFDFLLRKFTIDWPFFRYISIKVRLFSHNYYESLFFREFTINSLSYVSAKLTGVFKIG